MLLLGAERVTPIGNIDISHLVDALATVIIGTILGVLFTFQQIEITNTFTDHLSRQHQQVEQVVKGLQDQFSVKADK